MYEVGSEYSVPVLFEMMIEGKISLLLRERIVAETNQSYFPSYYSYGIMPSFSNNYGYVNKVKYDYFFLTDDGKIHRFKGRKKDILALMEDKYTVMKEYISKNKAEIYSKIKNSRSVYLEALNQSSKRALDLLDQIE